MLWVIYDSVLEVEHLQFVQKFPSEWIKNSTTTFFHTDNFNLFFFQGIMTLLRENCQLSHFNTYPLELFILQQQKPIINLNN